jgi:hypothetical protein
MQRALSENFSVFIVSSILLRDGDTLATTKVCACPVKESCKIRVSFDSRNGTGSFPPPRERLWITLPIRLTGKGIRRFWNCFLLKNTPSPFFYKAKFKTPNVDSD